jgi:hypothetical protein
MLQRAAWMFAILILFEGLAHADRVYYTLDLVENADIIGVWSKENVIDKSGSASLEKPEVLLKGSMDLLPVKIDSSLLSDLTSFFNQLKEKDDRLILFFDIPNPEAAIPASTVHLLRQFAYNRNKDLDVIQLKVLNRIIEQAEIAQKWSKLTPKQKIEYSDVITSGHIIHDELLEDAEYSIHLSKIYRGVCSGYRLEVMPALQNVERVLPDKLLSQPEIAFKEVKKENNDAGGTTTITKGYPTGRIIGPQALFFIQKNYGTGPDYILMDTVDVHKAGEYLKLIK